MLQSDLAAMIADLPIVMTWNGTGTTGTPYELVRTDELQEGGFLEDVDLSLVLPLYTLSSGTWASTFVAEPPLGDKVTVDSEVFKIVKKSKSPDKVALVLGLNTVRR
jgi:hypothetical protein